MIHVGTWIPFIYTTFSLFICVPLCIVDDFCHDWLILYWFYVNFILPVPIIPTFLYAIEHQAQKNPPTTPVEAQPTNTSIVSLYNAIPYNTNVTGNFTASSSAPSTNESSGVNSISADYGCKEDSDFLEEENVKVGLLFASKALVQLLVNPFVGPLTNR